MTCAEVRYQGWGTESRALGLQCNLTGIVRPLIFSKTSSFFVFTAIYWHCQITNLKNLIAFSNAKKQQENMYSFLVFYSYFLSPDSASKLPLKFPTALSQLAVPFFKQSSVYKHTGTSVAMCCQENHYHFWQSPFLNAK